MNTNISIKTDNSIKIRRDPPKLTTKKGHLFFCYISFTFLSIIIIVAYISSLEYLGGNPTYFKKTTHFIAIILLIAPFISGILYNTFRAIFLDESAYLNDDWTILFIDRDGVKFTDGNKEKYKYFSKAEISNIKPEITKKYASTPGGDILGYDLYLHINKLKPEKSRKTKYLLDFDKDCEELIPKLDMLQKSIEELNYKPIESPKSESPKDYFFTYCIGWTFYILIVVLLFIF